MLADKKPMPVTLKAIGGVDIHPETYSISLLKLFF